MIKISDLLLFRSCASGSSFRKECLVMSLGAFLSVFLNQSDVRADVNSGFQPTVAATATAADPAATPESPAESNPTDICAESDSGASKYKGFYFGAGLLWQQFNRKITFSDNIGSFAQDEETKVDDFGDRVNETLLDKNGNKFGGTFAAGWGHIFKDVFYFGFEASLDVTSSSQSEQTVALTVDAEGNKDDFITKVRTKGVIPTLSARLGGYWHSLDALIYLKGGISFLDNKFASNGFEDKDFGGSRGYPTCGIGIEKKIFAGNKGAVSLKVEWEHRFKNTRKSKYVGTGESEGYTAWPSSKLKSDAIRMMVVYHFNHF